MSFACPHGHESDDPDFCSHCGARLGAPVLAVPVDDERDAAPAPGAQPAPESVETTMPCPICGTVRFGDDRFCEGCGHDFLDPSAAVATEPETPTPTVPLEDDPPTWRALVSADRRYYDRTAPSDIAFPSMLDGWVVQLDRECVQIGRRSESRGSHPEIDLAGPPEDTAVSRAHAVLNRQADGSYALVDLGSANGTTVNDESTPLPENEPRALQHGDEIHVGAWTTITILRDPEPD